MVSNGHLPVSLSLVLIGLAVDDLWAGPGIFTRPSPGASGADSTVHPSVEVAPVRQPKPTKRQFAPLRGREVDATRVVEPPAPNFPDKPIFKKPPEVEEPPKTYVTLFVGPPLTPTKSEEEPPGKEDSSVGGEEPESEYVIICDLSSRTCRVEKAGKQVFYFKGIEYSRVGTGTKRGSNRTPLGEFNVTKEPRHRYGPVLRLCGDQGKRGILIHKDNTRDGGSAGCIHVGSSKTMRKLFDTVPNGARLIIQK